MSADAPVLSRTLAAELAPGTNVKGASVGGAWVYLLPDLGAEHVVCLGLPGPAALRTLAQLAGRVTVVLRARAAARARRRLERLGLAGVAVVSATASGGAGPAAGVVVVARGAPPGLDPGALLAPGGTVVRLGARSRAGGAGDRFWLHPARGEARLAVPAADRAARDYALRAGLHLPPARRARRAGPLARLAGRPGSGGVAELAPGHGRSPPPPAYVRGLAAAAGLDLAGRRWLLAAPGEYSSQKVSLVVFAADGDRPEYVVKLTRSPAFNGRLENERDALARVAEAGLAERSSVPQVAFFGHRRGLAILGETALEGSAFSPAPEPGADAGLRGAVEWVTELGRASVSPAAPGETGRALRTLQARFLDLYELAPAHHAFLEQAVERLGRAGPLPAVFQHGDFHTWNLLLRPGGGVGVLDWEAAEPRGVPLWDLAYLLHSYARRRGGRLGEDPALDGVASAAVRGYCRALGVPLELAEPLLVTCWMHRALKEATRLPRERLARGTFVSALRAAIDGRLGRRLAAGA